MKAPKGLKKAIREIKSRKKIVVGKVEKRDTDYLYFVKSDGTVLKQKRNIGRKKGSKNKC